MDYTLSNSFVTDAATTQRMHLAGQAIPTAVSDNDMNQVTWELMEIVKAGGQVGAPFDKAVPATYQKLLTALRAAGVFSTAAALDNTTKAATTAFVRAELLSLGNAVYASIFGAVKALSGYQRLPSGLIVQFGQYTSVASGTTGALSFPIAFPTACALLIPSASNNSAAAAMSAAVISPSQFSITSAYVAAQQTFVLAIGY